MFDTRNKADAFKHIKLYIHNLTPGNRHTSTQTNLDI